LYLDERKYEGIKKKIFYFINTWLFTNLSECHFRTSCSWPIWFRLTILRSPVENTSPIATLRKPAFYSQCVSAFLLIPTIDVIISIISNKSLAYQVFTNCSLWARKWVVLHCLIEKLVFEGLKLRIFSLNIAIFIDSVMQ
jgi:hypothetical protein